MDNGVYVLATEGPEYRVTYAVSIDKIYGDLDDETGNWKPNCGFIVEYFGGSQVYTDFIEAWDYAAKLSQDYDYLEDGVCLNTDFINFPFSYFEEGDDD